MLLSYTMKAKDRLSKTTTETAEIELRDLRKVLAKSKAILSAELIDSMLADVDGAAQVVEEAKPYAVCADDLLQQIISSLQDVLLFLLLVYDWCIFPILLGHGGDTCSMSCRLCPLQGTSLIHVC